MAKKYVVESAKAGTFPSSPGSSPPTISDIPLLPSGIKGFKHIPPDDEILQDGHHKEILSDADVPQAALAPSDMVLAASEPPMMLAMAEGTAAAGGVAGGEAAGAGGFGAGAILLGGAAVVGVGAWLIAETQHSNDTLYLFPGNNTANTDLHVVVEKSGAYIDANANGVLDGEESSHAAAFNSGGNADLATNSVVVHFNDVPDLAVDLTGFTMNDRIEIDIVAFNSHWMVNNPAFSIVDTGYQMSAGKSADDYVWFQVNTGNTSNYFTINMQSRYSSYLDRTVGTGLSLWSSWSDGTSVYQLAKWSDSGNPLNDIRNIMPGVSTGSGVRTSGTVKAITQLNLGAGHGAQIDFLWPESVHIVVERNGSFIDANANGILDGFDASNVAYFGSGENADLTAYAAVIHFNDMPLDPLNLTGFGVGDKIVFDMNALAGNSIMNSGTARLSTLYIGISSAPYFSPSDIAYRGTSGELFVVHQHGFYGYSDFNGSAHTASGGGIFAVPHSTVNSNNSGLIAYWSDPGNALNTNSQLIPSYNGGNTGSVLNRINAGTEHGAVEFLWPVHLVVEGSGVYIDANANGILDGGEGCNPAGFGSIGNADLAEYAVTIHFNALPAIPIDLAGFGADDRIEIDLPVISGASPNSRSSQTIMPKNTITSGHFRRGVVLTTTSTAVFASSGLSYVYLGKTVFSSASSHNHVHFTAGVNSQSGILAMNLYSAQISPLLILNQVDFLFNGNP